MPLQPISLSRSGLDLEKLPRRGIVGLADLGARHHVDDSRRHEAACRTQASGRLPARIPSRGSSVSGARREYGGDLLSEALVVDAEDERVLDPRAAPSGLSSTSSG